MDASVVHNEHYFLEHKEDVAFSFIHDVSVRDVLERHGIEKLVMISETYGRLLGQKDSCAFLSRKLLDMSLMLRSWASLVGEEGFFQILDEVKCIIILLLAFQEQALETQCVELDAFDTRISHDVDNIAMILHRRNHDM